MSILDRAHSIICRVSEETGVSVDDILGRRRTQAVARARQEAYVAVQQELTRLSPYEVGLIFARDRSVVARVKRKFCRMSQK